MLPLVSRRFQARTASCRCTTRAIFFPLFVLSLSSLAISSFLLLSCLLLSLLLLDLLPSSRFLLLLASSFSSSSFSLPSSLPLSAGGGSRQTQTDRHTDGQTRNDKTETKESERQACTLCLGLPKQIMSLLPSGIDRSYSSCSWSCFFNAHASDLFSNLFSSFVSFLQTSCLLVSHLSFLYFFPARRLRALTFSPFLTRGSSHHGCPNDDHCCSQPRPLLLPPLLPQRLLPSFLQDACLLSPFLLFFTSFLQDPCDVGAVVGGPGRRFGTLSHLSCLCLDP